MMQDMYFQDVRTARRIVIRGGQARDVLQGRKKLDQGVGYRLHYSLILVANAFGSGMRISWRLTLKRPISWS